MARTRSGTLAAWSCAWLAGLAGADDVLEATTGADAPHGVVGLSDPAGADDAGEPGSGAAPAPLLEALIAFRRSGAPVRVVLPAPGDIRGTPGPAAFRAAALDAGEAVVCGPLGLVPEVVDYSPSSAPTSVTWRAMPVEDCPPDPLDVGQAAADLAEAMRDATAALVAAGVGGAGSDVTDALRSARRAGERLLLPPGYPQRAVALLARAEQLHEVLEVAAADPLGAAVDRFAASAREASLRPLATAVRRARLAGYNALALTASS